MESFKIEYFRNEHPDEEFPHFRSLREAETLRLRKLVGERLGIEPSDPRTLATRAVERAEILQGQNADNPGFRLEPILRELGVDNDAEVLLNWYRFDQVDAMKAADLARHFSDIWYPGPDDLELLDWTGRWLVSVAHDGTVAVWRDRALS